MIFLSNKIQNISDSHPPRSKIGLLKFGFIQEIKILQKLQKKSINPKLIGIQEFQLFQSMNLKSLLNEFHPELPLY